MDVLCDESQLPWEAPWTVFVFTVSMYEVWSEERRKPESIARPVSLQVTEEWRVALVLVLSCIVGPQVCTECVLALVWWV